MLSLEKIFGKLFALSLIDVNVLMIDMEGHLQIYTYFPFKENICNSLQPEIYMSFQQMMNTFLNESIFFPNKIDNMHGCPVNVAITDLPPFITYQINSSNSSTKPYNIEGFEGKLLLFIANSLNFTLNLLLNVSEIGILYKNGTGTGIMGKVCIFNYF